MPAIITNKFRMNNAEQFQESFSETAATVYYLGIGRAQSYGTLTRPDGRTDYEGTETAPTTPGDSVLNEFKNYDDLGIFWCRMMIDLFFGDDDLDNIFVGICRK